MSFCVHAREIRHATGQRCSPSPVGRTRPARRTTATGRQPKRSCRRRLLDRTAVLRGLTCRRHARRRALPSIELVQSHRFSAIPTSRHPGHQSRPQPTPRSRLRRCPRWIQPRRDRRSRVHRVRDRSVAEVTCLTSAPVLDEDSRTISRTGARSRGSGRTGRRSPSRASAGASAGPGSGRGTPRGSGPPRRPAEVLGRPLDPLVLPSSPGRLDGRGMGIYRRSWIISCFTRRLPI